MEGLVQKQNEHSEAAAPVWEMKKRRRLGIPDQVTGRKEG